LTERIQKALANLGLGSRRAIERWVIDGRITIDGRVAKLGDQIAGRERVCVDGKPVRLTTAATSGVSHQHLAFYKTSDSRVTRDIEGAGQILEVPRPKRGRWIEVGGLDPNTSGLTVLTTDGELAHRLTRSTASMERVYAVRLLGEPTPAQLRELLSGVEIDGGRARLESIDRAGGAGNNFWFHAVLREGRHRELRAAFTAVGLAVSRVIRVRYGPVELGKLRRATSRPLSSAEVEALYELAGLPPPALTAAKRARNDALAAERPRSARGRRPGSHSARKRIV
jgi:23S rRNA pseudouridine2605 synthase